MQRGAADDTLAFPHHHEIADIFIDFAQGAGQHFPRPAKLLTSL